MASKAADRAKDRKAMVKAVGGWYRRHRSADPKQCFYCGARSQAWDHCPPVVWAYCLGFDECVKHGAQFVTVPVCKECNCALGSKRLLSLAQRKGFIAERLRNMYRKIRANPLWSVKELEELHGRLREHVQLHADNRLWIEQRIAFAEDGIWQKQI